ncbi:MAG TPA: VCBS repeat-containing protein [Polyangia bacterium]|nr:VCBS repeat-containing protein [Polyangia bacterium]
MVVGCLSLVALATAGCSSRGSRVDGRQVDGRQEQDAAVDTGPDDRAPPSDGPPADGSVADSIAMDLAEDTGDTGDTGDSAAMPDAATDSSTDVMQGGFRPAASFPVGAQPAFIAVGDLDEDGKLDVVTANSQTTTVSILLGNGDGTLSDATQVAAVAAGYAVNVVVADLNHDNHLDISAGIRAMTPGGFGLVAVLLGDGTGAFTLEGGFGANGPGPTALAVADVNGDANLDFVMATNDGNTIAVLLGNGDATFAVPALLSDVFPLLPTGLVVGHFFGDNVVDVITSSNNGGGVHVSRGLATGTFTHAGSFPAAAGQSSPFVVAEDFNRDGIPDLAVANAVDHAFSVLLGVALDVGTPNGVFGAPQPYSTGSGSVGSLALGDFNRDGRVDIAATSRTNQVTVFLASDGDAGMAGGFSLDANYRVGRTAMAVATGDFDNDGRPDLVTANFADSTVSILLNDRP